MHRPGPGPGTFKFKFKFLRTSILVMSRWSAASPCHGRPGPGPGCLRGHQPGPSPTVTLGGSFRVVQGSGSGQTLAPAAGDIWLGACRFRVLGLSVMTHPLVPAARRCQSHASARWAASDRAGAAAAQPGLRVWTPAARDRGDCHSLRPPAAARRPWAEASQ